MADPDPLAKLDAEIDAELRAAETDPDGIGRRARRVPYAMPAPPALSAQGLLTFEPESEYTLTATPQKPFKPLGLMLWDVGTLSVQAMVIGRQPQLSVSFGLVPARWFTVSQSFEQVVASFAEGKQPGQGWGTWDAMYPGILCRLSFNGPVGFAQALMWGLTTP